MKKILASVHRSARLIMISGWAAVAAIVIASAVLYIGAGEMFDYYSAIKTSENLLALSRPAAVAVCTFSLLAEYRSKQKNTPSD